MSKKSVPKKELDKEVSTGSIADSFSTELFESIKSIKAFLEDLSNAVAILDLQGNILYCNKKAEEITGFTLTELVGKKYFTANLLQDKYVEKATAMVVSDVLTQPIPFNEFGLKRKDGSLTTVEASSTPVKLHGETIVIASMHDISERKQAEAQLVSQSRFAMENPSPVLRVSREGVVLFNNKASVPLLLVWQTSSGKPLPRDWRRLVEDVYKTQTNKTAEIKCEERTFLLNIVAIKDFNYVNIYGTDISERKQAEQVIKNREAFLNQVVEQTPNALWLSDDKGTVIRMNQALRDLLLITDEEIIGKYNVLKDTQVIEQGFLPLVKSVFEEGKTVNFTLGYFTEREKQVKLAKKAHRVIDVVMSPIKNEQGKIINVICQEKDITEQEEAKVALEESETRYRALFEEAIDGIALIDAETGMFTRCNFAYEKLTGRTQAEMQKLKLWEIRPPEQIEVAQQFLSAIKDNEQEYIKEMAFQKPDGTVTPVEAKARIITINGKKYIQSIARDISGRKQADEQIRFLSQILDVSLDPVFLPDLEGNLIYVNRAACSALGYTREELLKMSLHQLDTPESAQLIPLRMKNLLEKGQASFEVNHRRKDGSVIPFEINARVIERNGGKYILSVARDISERQRMDKALRTSEANFRNSLDKSSLGIRIVTADGKTLYTNRALLDIWGYSSTAELEATPHHERYTPEDYLAYQERVAKRKRGEFVPPEFEVNIKRKDGKVRHVSVSRKDVLWNGSPQFQIIYQDITERYSAEAALRESEEKYHNLVERASDGICILQDARVKYGNQHLAQMWGGDAGEIVGKPFADFIHPDSLEIVVERYRQRMAGKAVPPICQVGLRRKDGSKIDVELNAGIISYLGKPADMVIIRDITERKRVEQALRQSQTRFENLANLLPLSVFETDTQSNFTYYNEESRKIWGITSEYKAKNSMLDIVISSDRDRVLQDAGRILKGENIGGQEYTALRLDGTTFPILVYASSIIRENEIVGIRGVSLDISGRKRAEAEILRQSNILEGINHIFQATLRSDTFAEVARICLTIARDLTVSQYGWIGEINPSGRLDTVALSDPGWDACRIPGAGTVKSISNMEIRGIWGNVIKEGKSLITNDPAHHPDKVGIPEGHPALNAFLGVPLKDSGRTIGMISLANKPSGYTEEDRESIEKLSVAIVEALRRKRAEEALRESEQRLKEAQSLGKIGNWEFDLTSQLVTWSDEMYELYELDKTQGPLSLEAMVSFFSPEDTAKWREAMQLVVESGQEFHTDLHATLPNGRAAFLYNSIRAIKDNRGEVVKLFGTVEDITERKKVEAALSESEAKFRTFFEAANEGISVINGETRKFTYVNPAFCNMLGYRIEELLNMRIEETHPPEARKRIIADFEARLKGKVAEAPFIMPIFRKDGKTILVQANSAPTYIDGKLSSVAFFTDVTERQRAEAALIESEQRFRMLFESATEGISVIDSQTRKFIYANPAFCNMLGYSVEELVNMKIEETHPPDVSNQMIADFEARLIEKAAGKPFLTPIRRKDGTTIIVQATSVFTNIEKKLSLVAFFTDVTEREKAAAVLKENEQRLKEAQKLGKIGSYEVDEATLDVVWSEEMYEIFERDKSLPPPTAEELPGYFTPEEFAKLTALRLTVCREGKEMHQDITARLPSGNTPILHISIRPVKDDKGQVIKTFGIYQDVSESKRAEEQIALQAQLLDAAMDAVFVHDPDTNFIYVNQAACNLLGYSKEEYLKMTLSRVVAPEYQHLIASRNDEALAKGWNIFESVHIRKDGSIVPVEVYSHLTESGGRKLILTGTRDITERKQAEGKLRENERRLKEAQSLGKTGSFEVDLATQEVTWSEELFRLLQRDPAAGSPSLTEIVNYYLPQEQKRGIENQADFMKMLKNTGEIRQDTTVTLPDGRKAFHHLSVVAVRNLQGNITKVFGTVQDITERMHAEAELKQSYDKLQKTLEGIITAMAATVEIRDPYTAGHQHNTGQLALAIAQEMGLPQERINGIHTAGLIHDVGKIGIPADILSKPGKLNPLEFSLIKVHSQIGYDVLKNIDFPYPVAQWILQHHERLNGSGYPAGLTGDQISLEAKILAVADTVEAMASHRPYRPALGVPAALDEIAKWKGTLYDKDVVDACMRLFKEKGYKLN